MRTQARAAAVKDNHAFTAAFLELFSSLTAFQKLAKNDMSHSAFKCRQTTK